MKRTLSLIGCAFLTLATSQADLDFKTKRASHEATAEETQFEAVFSFKNTGKHPVVINKVDSNCGCISATTDKDRYEKGESGKVSAIFKIGSAEGIQTKSITLVYEEDLPVVKPKVIAESTDPLAFTETSEPIKPVKSPSLTDRLTVELVVPTLVQIDPKITKWDVNSEAATKTIQITMDHTDPVSIKSVRSSRDNIIVETKEIEAGKRYEILITPQTTKEVQLGMLTIETDSEIKKHRKKLAFFSIQRPAPEPPQPAVEPEEDSTLAADDSPSAAQADTAPEEDPSL